jgi:hypothetical protein
MMRRAIVGLCLAVSLTGCMGHFGLRGKLTKFNLEVVENRWGREGLFVLMFPGYVIATAVDILVLNSIEFWSGSNPINGRSPLVDLPKSEIPKLGLEHVEVVQIERLDETSAYLHVEFDNGDRATFDVVREGDAYTISYAGVEFFRGDIGL